MPKLLEHLPSLVGQIWNSVNDPLASIIACIVLNLATNHNQHKVLTQVMLYFIFQEVEIINNVQDLLRKTIDQAEKQIK